MSDRIPTKLSRAKAAAAIVRANLGKTGIDPKEFEVTGRNYSAVGINCTRRRLTASVGGLWKLVDAIDNLQKEIEK